MSILQPICDATKSFSAGRHVNVIESFVVIKRLEDQIRQFALDEDLEEAPKKIVSLIQKNLPLRLVITKQMLACALLDPNLKSSVFVEEELEKHETTGKDLLQEMITKFAIQCDSSSKRPATTDNNDKEPIKKRKTGDQKKISIEPSLEDIEPWKKDIRISSATFNQKEIKISSYLETQYEPLNTIAFWKEQNGFLRELAQSMLSMPVSSASSERSFSIARYMITDNRASLSPKTVEASLFVKMNYSFIKTVAQKLYCEQINL